jgi:hypothetical protein
LINVTGGEDMTLFDVNVATSLIYEAAGADANIIFGAVIDPSLHDEMRVTVIATGFGNEPVIAKVASPKHETARPASVMSLFPEETVTVASHPEPEPVMVDAEDAFATAQYTSSSQPAGNGNGNGHHHHRFRVPSFSNDDVSVPAYIRRLEDNR